MDSSKASPADVQPWRRSTRGIGPRLSATFGFLTFSTLSVACLITPRKKEWIDICLDYCYAKRAFDSHTFYDRFFTFLKKLPK
ncbi:hypothetical protein CSUI_009916 [Cystoisospora suis]|uniref:Transmembrane protein n=1 Tax=Cystoisospora suis TaxID=483139 RepID=A0A2C6K0U8_9APIC|nr:hypothetical protein CSUI_009916 [Cystoisospora suis]